MPHFRCQVSSERHATSSTYWHCHWYVQGEAVTGGLRKVTDDMKTKNRADRTGVVSTSAGGACSCRPWPGLLACALVCGMRRSSQAERAWYDLYACEATWHVNTVMHMRAQMPGAAPAQQPQQAGRSRRRPSRPGWSASRGANGSWRTMWTTMASSSQTRTRGRPSTSTAAGTALCRRASENAACAMPCVAFPPCFW